MIAPLWYEETNDGAPLTEQEVKHVVAAAAVLLRAVRSVAKAQSLEEAQAVARNALAMVERRRPNDTDSD